MDNMRFALANITLLVLAGCSNSLMASSEQHAWIAGAQYPLRIVDNNEHHQDNAPRTSRSQHHTRQFSTHARLTNYPSLPPIDIALYKQ